MAGEIVSWWCNKIDRSGQFLLELVVDGVPQSTFRFDTREERDAAERDFVSMMRASGSHDVKIQ